VVVSGSLDETVRLWAVNTGELIDFFSEDLVHAITCVTLSPDSGMLAEGSFDSTVRLWQLGEGTRTYRVLSRIRADADKFERRRLSQRGSQVASRASAAKRKSVGDGFAARFAPPSQVPTFDEF
jgi:WD40 repeat protein